MTKKGEMLISQESGKKTYSTRSKAGDVAELPERLATITNKNYSEGLSFNNSGRAYLRAFRTEYEKRPFKYAAGVMTLDGSAKSVGALNDLVMKGKPEKVDLVLIQVIFSIILFNMKKADIEKVSVDKIINIYYPDFVRMQGGASNFNKKNYEAFQEKLEALQTIVGVIGEEIYPLIKELVFVPNMKVFSFSSPYLVRLIQTLDEEAKSVKPPQNAYVAYNLYASVCKKCRCKEAITNANIIITLIARAGATHTPHISASTIIERNQELMQKLERYEDQSNKNALLERVFKKTWEILRDYTDLQDKYKNIDLPVPKDDEKNGPTCTTCNMVFKFKHQGRNK